MMKGKNKPEEGQGKPMETTDEPVATGAAATAEKAVDSAAVSVDPAVEIAKLQAELAEANDKILRAHAEFDNFRKRTFKDIANTRAMTQSDTVLPFLHLFDNVAMAMGSAEKAANMDAILQGLRMIVGEYERAISDLGIVKYNAVGEKFDPLLHDAIAHEPSDEIPEGVVTKQWTCGYKFGERLLRPARVVVSSGPEKK